MSRKEPKPHCLSTLEATAQALKLVEADAEAAEQAGRYLLAALGKLVEVQLEHSVEGVRKPRFVGRGEESAMSIREARRRDIETGNPSPTVELRGGAMMRGLRKEDAGFVADRWPHSNGKSRQMIERQIEEGEGCGCCLGIEFGGVVRAALLRYPGSGALGMLHVDEDHRRKGWGSALLAEAEEALKRRGDERLAFILDGNVASEKLFESRGWRRDDPEGFKRGTGRRRAKRRWVKD